MGELAPPTEMEARCKCGCRAIPPGARKPEEQQRSAQLKLKPMVDKKTP